MPRTNTNTDTNSETDSDFGTITCENCTVEQLEDINVVILDDKDVDAFVSAIGITQLVSIRNTITIFTEDQFTKNTTEFNLLDVFENGEYEVVTQLNHPFKANDTVLDLRTNSTHDFTDFIMGL